jgi:LysR family tcuABC transcriptional regulator
MELRQLRYFVSVVEVGSISRAALDLNLVQSALSQQITRLEVDSLAMLMDAVRAGMGATLQPWAAVARQADAAQALHMARITDHQVRRSNVLCSLLDDELSPAALAARVVLVDCVRALVGSGAWVGAVLSDPGPAQVYTKT